MAEPPLTPPGWHADPEQPDMWRYWDGSQWTEHRHPGLPGAPPRDRASTVLLVVSYVGALVLPIVGFILGIVLLVRRQTSHGLAVVLISVAVTIVAWQLLDDVEELNRNLQQDQQEADDLGQSIQQDSRTFTRCLENNDYRFAACRDLLEP